MKNLALSLLFCLVCATGCRPRGGSAFLATFNPVTTLKQIGDPAGISYLNGGASYSSSGSFFGGAQIQKDWEFSSDGSHTTLRDQLVRFRKEVESELSSSGAKIVERGDWSGNFSGFGFQYQLRGKKGLIRVMGVSLESGKQGMDVFVYEH